MPSIHELIEQHIVHEDIKYAFKKFANGAYFVADFVSGLEVECRICDVVLGHSQNCPVKNIMESSYNAND